MTFKLKTLGLLTGAIAAVATSAFALDVDLSPEQPNRPRAEKVQAAIDLIPADYAFFTPGKLTVATTPWQLPFGVYGSDTKTPVGAEPDIAQIVADSLGLELEIVAVAWPDWPLGVASGKYDAVISNVTVTEERKEKFDFSTYRQDLLGFYVKSDSAITEIKEAKDVAGLRVIVGSGTNQEQILLRWIEENKAAGLADTEVQYYDDETVQDLAIQSGRADAYLGPNAAAAFKTAQKGDTKLVGSISGGYPITAEIAVVTRKDSGLAAAVTAAINAQIASGTYGKVLARWGVESEAVTESRTNPPGLPKQ